MDLATRKMFYYGLLGLLIAGSTIAAFRMAPQVMPFQFLAKDGTFAVLLNNIPSDISSDLGVSGAGLTSFAQAASIHSPPLGLTVISLNVTIDSVTIHKSGPDDTGWTEISKSSVTIDLLKQSSVSTLLASDKVPAENVTMVQLHVSSASAAVKDAAGAIRIETVMVSSDVLKVPLGAGANVKGQMSTSVVVDRPHIVIEGNNETIRLNPVLGVDSISGPK